MPSELDTIVAPATPLGRGALAIVRIDGPRSGDILRKLGGVSPDPRLATLAQLNLDGEPLDECIAIRYAAPHSFTGNDLVELTLHGSPLLVERVIELAKLQLEIRTEENETQVIVRLFGEDARLLTEEHGELLDALQVLGNKAMVGRKVEKEIELNCEAFKERRAEQLAGKAKELADRVRSSGREQLLPAMTPIERRIVHLALQEDPDVTTESRGEGLYKRVAVVMRDAAE